MNTSRIYQKDVYLRSFTASVTSVDDNIVTLDQTAFFPEGGGQSCDLGTINGFRVLDVQESDGEIFHTLEDSHTLKAGDAVSCELDWERRFLNMQRHCGEHILTGVIYREYGGVNRGFHMGDEYMTIDIAMEDNPEYTALTWDMLLEAERMTNELIWENVPMITRHFDTYEEAANEPVRKKIVLEGDITLVGIGSPENGWGCCACCGTHPSHTGQVGLVKVFKLEPNKGMFRIYFEAGRAAMADYSKRFDITSTLGTKYSAGPDDLLDKIKVQEDKNKETRVQLNNLRQSVIKEKADTIQQEIGDGNVHCYSFDELSLDDIRNMSKKLDFSDSKLIMFTDSASLTCLLYSGGKADCGKLVKDNASVFGGKGGGRADNAQAKFDNVENMHLFTDAVEKILR